MSDQSKTWWDMEKILSDNLTSGEPLGDVSVVQLADALDELEKYVTQEKIMNKQVKFIRNGSPKWIGIKFPKRKGAVWVHQSDFDDLVDTILKGIRL